MRFVSFDPFRTLHLRDVTYVKPEEFWAHRDLLRQASCLLYPAYWQIHALAYGLRARIFPSLASYHLGHDKVEMTRAFWMVCPDHVPRTLILPNEPGAWDRAHDELRPPFVVKVVKSAQGAGVFRIESRADWDTYAEDELLLYVQELIPAARDLRLVVVGDDVIGGYWREHAPGCFHNNVARGARVVHGPIPAATIELVTRVAHQLGIDHAGFDRIELHGTFYLLELHRRFGYQGLTEQGISLAPLLQRCLDRLLEPDRPRDGDPFARAS